MVLHPADRVSNLFVRKGSTHSLLLTRILTSCYRVLELYAMANTLLDITLQQNVKQY